MFLCIIFFFIYRSNFFPYPCLCPVILLSPLLHPLQCLLHNKSLFLLCRRRRVSVNSSWISSVFCPILPVFYYPPPHLSLWVSLRPFTYLPPRGFPLLLRVVYFTNQSPTCHSHPPSLHLSLSALSWCASFPGFEPEYRSFSLKSWEYFPLPNSQIRSAPRQRRLTRLQRRSLIGCHTDGSAFQELSDNGWWRECACYVKKQCHRCTLIQTSCEM